MARELGSRGITVNAIAPGFVDTEMTEVLSEEIREMHVSRLSWDVSETGGYCKYSGISGIRQSRLYYRTGHQRRWRYERINKENKMRRVVITGMGAITPVGLSVEEFWNSVKKENKLCRSNTF